MNLTLPIPDEISAHLGSERDVTRRALEAFAADEYRAGRLSHPELRSLLGFETHHQLDAFLKARDIYEDYTLADLEKEIQDARRMGY